MMSDFSLNIVGIHSYDVRCFAMYAAFGQTSYLTYRFCHGKLSFQKNDEKCNQVGGLLRSRHFSRGSEKEQMRQTLCNSSTERCVVECMTHLCCTHGGSTCASADSAVAWAHETLF